MMPSASGGDFASWDDDLLLEWEPYEFTTERAWDEDAAVSAERVRDVLVVGDIHGNVKHLGAAVDQTVDLGVDAIVQVGDFWLSDRQGELHRSEEARFMWEAHGSPVPVVVLDGNHEDWPTLTRYSATDAAQAAYSSRRPLHLGGSVWWAWRGSTWTWDGMRCAALGGAVSPDRRDRAVRHWRWPEEGTTRADLDRLLAHVGIDHGCSLDVLFTHDAPGQVLGLKGGMPNVPQETLDAISDSRRLLAEAVDATRPRLVIHGHWHRSHRERIGAAIESVGLANDGHRDHLARLTADPEPRVDYLN